jgi:hypothetical protein
MTDLEKIIRPIVEGQIRGFLKEHPNIVEAVDWYRVPGRDKAQTFIGSLSKRIVRDLTCGRTSARLAAAFLALRSEASPELTMEAVSCGNGGALGSIPERPVAALSGGDCP